MVRLNFIVSFLACMSIPEHVFCSEISDIDQLNSNIPVASSSKLFGNDADCFEDDLENIFMTQKAVRAFLALQDIEGSDHENCEQELFVLDDDYFLIGKGCDIEDVVVSEVSQLSFDTISEKIGLAYFDGDKEIE